MSMPHLTIQNGRGGLLRFSYTLGIYGDFVSKVDNEINRANQAVTKRRNKGDAESVVEDTATDESV